ncbi:hypothetical protein OG21DRAFT_1521441 [Imleria badia]|nr:hypothetical protein OG21DRAFT_1521441 [Imleria badia]
MPGAQTCPERALAVIPVTRLSTPLLDSLHQAILFSNSYPFYQLDGALPSLTSQSPRPSPYTSPATSRPVSAEPQTPEEHLIQYHEANQLNDSAVCFEKSAKEQGGCGVGMLMWGLTLRHGWGCEKNEKSGFKWLTKAAESAVQGLEKVKKGLEVKRVKEELVLAIYEPRYAPPTLRAYAPPRPLTSQRVPNSPLLHTNFQSSTASTATNITALHANQKSRSFLSLADDCEPDEGCYEEDDNYGQRLAVTVEQSDSWSQATGPTQPPTLSYTDPEDLMHHVPTVVVSSPQDDDPTPNVSEWFSKTELFKTSLFSNSYPFYQLDGALPSLTSQSPRPSPYTSPATSRPVSAEPQTPEEHLIQYHEANQLNDSAVCFEKSAKEQGGCGVGMLMWGLTLRHGWGCEKNEKSGFKWLTKAAESAVQGLEKVKKGLEVKRVKEELVLAIYEGWGAAKDQKISMAVSYYRVSAKLGDADAE